MPQLNVVEAINNALTEEMQADPRVMVLGLDELSRSLALARSRRAERRHAREL